MAEDKVCQSLLEHAQQAFKKYYARCFWHMRPDLVVTEAILPTIIKGLRNNGDREAFLEADRLEKQNRN